MSTIRPADHLYAPRYWGSWLIVGLLRLLVALPRPWAFAGGRALGRGLLRVAARRRRIAATNLELCFPELPAADRRRLLRAHFESIGLGMVETAMTWWLEDAELGELGEVEGLEHLQRALDRGKGVILLTGHFTTMEISSHIMGLHVLFHVMYRPQKDPVFDRLMRRGRAARLDRRFREAQGDREAARLYSRGDPRSLLRSLRRNQAVWYAPDQDPGRRHSVFAPFFGHAAATITAPSRLARMSGAAVVPYFPRRLPSGRYRAVLLPALEGFPSGNDQADAARINRLVEEQVRQVPEQYLWVHRRFKTRPEGELSWYSPGD